MLYNYSTLQTYNCAYNLAKKYIARLRPWLSTKIPIPRTWHRKVHVWYRLPSPNTLTTCTRRTQYINYCNNLCFNPFIFSLSVFFFIKATKNIPFGVACSNTSVCSGILDITWFALGLTAAPSTGCIMYNDELWWNVPNWKVNEGFVSVPELKYFRHI